MGFIDLTYPYTSFLVEIEIKSAIEFVDKFTLRKVIE